MMNTTRLAITLLVVFVLLPTPASAGMTSQQLLDQCDNVEVELHSESTMLDANKIGICLGFTIGAINAHATITHFSETERLYCLPADLPTTDIVTVWKAALLKLGPEYLSYDATDTMTVALMNAFPCESQP